MDSSVVYAGMTRVEYQRALGEQPGLPSDITKFVSRLPATGLFEDQAWMTPVPLPSEITGETPLEPMAKLLDAQASRIRMREYKADFRLTYKQMEDDQPGLHKDKPAQLVRGSEYGVRLSVLAHAAAARAQLSFEGVAGQYNAANSHTVGTGDNLIDGTATDTSKETAIVMYVGRALKPTVWYDRKKPELITDVGTEASRLRGDAVWRSYYRGAPAFGPWWDMVFVDMGGFATASEWATILTNVRTQFRTFTYPDGSKVHETTEFNSGNTVILIGPKNESGLATLLNQTQYVTSVDASQQWKNWATPVIYSGMDQD